MADDTAKVQKLIDVGGRVVIPPGIYLIDATKSLTIMRPGTELILEGVSLRCIPNADKGYKILWVRANDVRIKGGWIVGDRKDHKGTEGEWGHGIRVGSGDMTATGVVLDGVTAMDCWGDGFYIDGAKKVNMQKCKAINNRRQGLSVIAVEGLEVRGCTFERTNGTLPSDGIDLEPDKDDVIRDVKIIDCKLINNKGAGIEVAGKRGKVRNVAVAACIYKGNQPTKIGGVANESKYQPSLLAYLMGKLGDYSGYPTSFVIP